MTWIAPRKDPNNVEPYFFVFCDKDGTNDGSATDRGELQGQTISSYSITEANITKDSDNKAAVTIQGVDYGVDTVVTVWTSAGTAGTDATLSCRAVTSDGRTLDATMIIPVVEN